MAIFRRQWVLPTPTDSSPQTINLPNRNLTLVQSAPSQIIWAVGGGKGGIGKTLLTSNLAIFLSWLHKKVIVVDLDLGGANLHTSLGVTSSPHTVGDLLYKNIDNPNSLVQPTQYKNVSLISGSNDPINITNMPPIQRSRLVRKLRELDADFILLDLGAGTSVNTLEFFLLADQKIVVVTPEPTSIENAYRFIKTAFYRLMRNATATPYIRQLIEQTMEDKIIKGISSPKELINEIARLSPSEGEQLKKTMNELSMSLIVNQVRAKAEADIGKSIQIVSERYFGARVNYAGFLPYDNSVWQSIRKRVPFLIDSPNSMAVTHLEETVRNLLKQNKP
ncbi:MAG: MinD/ParA family protein [Proteobacteria bacterium]|nr:MinD/ParA family protein [Pseudomonadota bacterium]